MAGRKQGAQLETLARRLCPHKTDGQVEHQLVPSAGRKLSPSGARAHAIDRVAAVVARTCEWGEPMTDWDVGDFRFLVLDFGPRKDVSLYVQIWTEPGEPVLIEACSGAWNPTARPYVRAPQRAALRKLGYAVGGRARNYRKHWTLSPLADARALAEELLSILVEIFGYRGQRPLGMAYCSEGRSEPGRVFPALAVDDVKRMLGIAGCQVVDVEPVGPVGPGVKQRLIHVAQPFPFVVEMRGQATKAPATYEAMRLVTPLPAGRGLSPGELEAMVRECPFGRTFRDDEGDLLFIADHVVTGTTVRWFLTTIRVWAHMRQRAVEMLRLALAPPSPGTPGGRGGGGGGGGEDEADADGDDDDSADDDEKPGRSRQARVTVH
jgi:hypothetical protein